MEKVFGIFCLSNSSGFTSFSFNFCVIAASTWALKNMRLQKIQNGCRNWNEKFVVLPSGTFPRRFCLIYMMHIGGTDNYIIHFGVWKLIFRKCWEIWIENSAERQIWPLCNDGGFPYIFLRRMGALQLIWGALQLVKVHPHFQKLKCTPSWSAHKRFLENKPKTWPFFRVFYPNHMRICTNFPLE